jgi:hypothetical protein
MNPHNHLNLIGKQFSRLTVLREVGRSNCNGVVWECICECSKHVEVRSGNLRSGNTRSCGCLRDEVKRTTRHQKHGHYRKRTMSPTYMSWVAAKTRCSNKKVVEYPRYGGRGIRMCDEWTNSFEAFLHDMGERPSGKTLDRIDTDGNYEPGNCRWATPKEQANNRKNNVALRKKAIQ